MLAAVIQGTLQLDPQRVNMRMQVLVKCLPACAISMSNSLRIPLHEAVAEAPMAAFCLQYRFICSQVFRCRDVHLAFLHSRSGDSAPVSRLLLGVLHLPLQRGNLGMQIIYNSPLRRYLVNESCLCNMGILQVGLSLTKKTVVDDILLLSLLLQGNVEIGDLTTLQARVC